MCIIYFVVAVDKMSTTRKGDARLPPRLLPLPPTHPASQSFLSPGRLPLQTLLPSFRQKTMLTAIRYMCTPGCPTHILIRMINKTAQPPAVLLAIALPTKLYRSTQYNAAVRYAMQYVGSTLDIISCQREPGKQA